MEKQNKPKQDIGVQCSLNISKYIKDTEKKLKDSKKYYLSEFKAFKKKISGLETEKNIFIDEEKKYVYKIKVIINIMFNI